MKKLSTTIFLLFTSVLLYCQQNCISAHLGLSAPMGLYGSTEDKDGAAYAQTGLSMQLMYTNDIGKYYWGVQSNFFTNALNTTAFTDNILKTTGGNGKTTASGYGGLSLQVISGYNFFSDDDYTVGAHFKPGLTSLLLSSIENTTVVNGNSIVTKRDAAGAISLSLALGAQARFKLSDMWVGFASLDYYIVSGNFTNVPINQYVNNTYTGSVNDSGKARFNNLQFNLGVGYMF